MTPQTILSIASASLGLIGSVILAFSVNRPLSMLRGHLTALDVTVQALIGGQNVPVLLGFDVHHERSFRHSTRLVRFGCALIFLAFAAQLVSSLWPALVSVFG